MQKPVFVLTCGFSAGLLLGHGFFYFPCTILLFSLITIIVALYFCLRGRITFQRFLLFVLPGFVGIAAYLYSAAWLPADHYTRLIPDDKAIHEVTGRITSALDRDPDRTAFLLDISEIDGGRTAGLVRVTVREPTTSIGYGDRVTIAGKLSTPGRFLNPHAFDYPAYLAQSGVHRLLSAKTEEQIRVIRHGKGIFRTIQDWRERIRRTFLASTSGPGSAILQAMVLGEEGGLTDEVRDQFLAAGVTHIISISGSHLGMVALLCFGFVRLLVRLLPERIYLRLTLHGDPRKFAAWITLPLVLFYTLLAGGQTATVRSLFMILAALLALILDRENALLHSLAIAALLILAVSPQALFDISFQLSFISVITIGFVVQLWNELPLKHEGFVRKTALSVLLLVIISLATSIATGPLVAHYFNQFSLAGIVSNMIVVPFAGVIVVPLGLFSGVISLFTGQLPLAALNQAVADWFLVTVSFFSRMPLAEFHPRAPGVLWLVCYTALVVSVFVLVRTRLLFTVDPFRHSARRSRTLIVIVFLSLLLLVAAAASTLYDGRTFRVSFPDVGQGDCALIELPGDRNILIDGGGSADERFDIGRRVLAPFLWNRGVRKLDLVILSHPHPDHMNGLKFVLSKFDVAEIWTHDRDEDLPGYDRFKQIVREQKITRTIVSPGMPPWKRENADISVIHPAADFRSPEKKAYAIENDNSLVVKVVFKDRVLLFTGDIGTEAEHALLRRGPGLRCDLLKVPHHGSKSSSSEEFVNAVRPSVAVVTVGRRNTYHHPSHEVLDRYESIGAHILRTDRDGAIVLTMVNGELEHHLWKELELERMDTSGHDWSRQERENWKRVWIRKWEL